jgi:SH3-like domain-containing protein
MFLSATNPAFAIPKMEEKNFFASLRSSETNVRAGPGGNYPVKYKFTIRGIPVMVINEYDNWYEIKDYDGETGWVNQNLLTKKRTVLARTAKSFINLYSAETEKSRVILRIENNVIGELIKCKANWCGIKVKDKKGWVDRKEIWGDDVEE